MKTRVLLVSNNCCTTPDPVFPLGLSFLNSALRQAGHDTLWADKLVGNESIADVAAGFRPDVAGISVRNIDDVIISKRETYFDNLALLVETIRQAAGCPVVLGGSGFSIFPRQLLELSGANYGIRGEGEAAFVSLIAALRDQSELCGIPGLVYRVNGRVVVNRNDGAAPTCHLTADDRPAAIARYYLRNGGMMNLQTQRGCACHCCYCTYPLIEGSHARRRLAEAVADEFAQLQDLGCRYVSIVDSVFNSSPRHVGEICEALLRRGTKLPWGCFLRPRGLSAELMRLMRRADFRISNLDRTVLVMRFWRLTEKD
ncbi:MAG: B12-binding domain-containing radical SAM protein [Limisphaerales bacterium]